MPSIRPARWPSTLLVSAALIVTMLSSPLVAGDKTKPPKGKAAAEAADRTPVWPLPPEPARIRYVTSFRGVADFSAKPPKRWKSALFGQDPSDARPPDALVKPYGVAVSPSGLAFVTDTASRRVFVFDMERRTVTFLGDKEPGKLSKPTGIAVGPDGSVFVADATLNRIFAFGPDRRLTLAIGREGELESPAGLAVDGERGLLYVADSKKHQVLCYSTSDGAAVKTIGRRGGEPGEFNFPTNVVVDKDGRLFVTDTLNFRIQSFNPDGTLLSVFGTLGDTPGSLNRPKGVGIDGEGHIYVADSSFNNFQIFDQSGQLLLFVGSVGSGPGEFLLPAGLFIDRKSRIYVVDQGNARVQVFQYLRAQAR